MKDITTLKWWCSYFGRNGTANVIINLFAREREGKKVREFLLVLQKKYGKSAGFGLHMMCVWKKGSQVGTYSAKLQLIQAQQSFEHRFSANIYYLVPWNRQAAAPFLRQNSCLCRQFTCAEKISFSGTLGGSGLATTAERGWWDTLLLSALILTCKCCFWDFASSGRNRATGSAKGGKNPPDKRHTSLNPYCICWVKPAGADVSHLLGSAKHCQWRNYRCHSPPGRLVRIGENRRIMTFGWNMARPLFRK